MQTDGLQVTQVSVRCVYCGGKHTHPWFGETDGLRTPSCTPYGAVYRITIDTKMRLRVDQHTGVSPISAEHGRHVGRSNYPRGV